MMMRINIDGVIRDCTQEEIEAYKVVETPKNIIIQELKTLLTNSDYKAIKYAEGLLSDEEYEPIKLQRQEWRKQINELEKQLE